MNIITQHASVITAFFEFLISRHLKVCCTSNGSVIRSEFRGTVRAFIATADIFTHATMAFSNFSFIELQSLIFVIGGDSGENQKKSDD